MSTAALQVLSWLTSLRFKPPSLGGATSYPLCDDVPRLKKGVSELVSLLVRRYWYRCLTESSVAQVEFAQRPPGASRNGQQSIDLSESAANGRRVSRPPLKHPSALHGWLGFETCRLTSQPRSFSFPLLSTSTTCTACPLFPERNECVSWHVFDDACL